MIIFDLDGCLADCEHRRNFFPVYKACVDDTPIQPVIEQWNIQISLGMMGVHKIWSVRCESVREQTEIWLDNNLLCFDPSQLKMRPIGDNTPDDQLKERWLDERCSDYMKAIIENRDAIRHDIDYVYDDRPKVVSMWRRRGIFVFDVNQSVKDYYDRILLDKTASNAYAVRFMEYLTKQDEKEYMSDSYRKSFEVLEKSNRSND